MKPNLLISARCLIQRMHRRRKYKVGFIGQLKLALHETKLEWELDEDFGFATSCGLIVKVCRILPTTGRLFLTDGASIPRLCWTLIGGPLTGLYQEAAVIHDWLYCVHMVSRKKADQIFLEAMKISGVNRVKRNLMYAAVRIGGSAAYHSHDHEQ